MAAVALSLDASELVERIDEIASLSESLESLRNRLRDCLSELSAGIADGSLKVRIGKFVAAADTDDATLRAKIELPALESLAAALRTLDLDVVHKALDSFRGA